MFTCSFLRTVQFCADYMMAYLFIYLDMTSWWAHLVQVGVSGNVIAPLLGKHAALSGRPWVADPHSLDSGPVSQLPAGRGTRRGGQRPQSARCCASTQRQRGFSWEGVHVACAETSKVKITTHPAVRAGLHLEKWTHAAPRCQTTCA